MKLYLVSLRFKRPRRGRVGAEAVVHAKTKKAAKDHIDKRFTGCTIERAVAIDSSTSKHFVIADLEE